MTKKRLLIYAALIFVFAVACMGKIMPSLIADAVEVTPAEIGTAKLTDAGDTVFIREAIFTVGGKAIRASGFTVANAAAGENPAAGINLDVLTPITTSNTLTGTLDKNIYVCSSDKGDIYLGNLKLAQGRKIYTDGSSLNFLGGSVEADSIETTGFIAVGSADVTVNSDLTGFNYITLFVSRSSSESVAGFDTPSTMTVNGNVSNSGQSGYAAISAVGGSKVKVTGSITTEHALVFNNSSLEVGGDVTIAQSHGGMCLNLNDNSTAVIGGKIKTNDWVHIYKNSSLKAGSVESTLLAARNNSYFEIENDVTVSQYLDIGEPDASETCKIGGNLKCTGSFINLVGRGNDNRLNFYVGGDIVADTQFYTKYCNLDVDGGIRHTWGVFNFQYSTVDVAKDIDSDGNFELDNSTMNVHGNVKDGGLSPIRWSTLVIEGDGNFVSFDPMRSSNVTVKGNLTSTAYFLMANTGATLKVEKDINCNQFCIYDSDNNGATIETGGNLNATYVNVNRNCNLIVGGNLNSSGQVDVMDRANCTVNGDVNAQSVGVYGNAALGVDGDVNATSWITSEGNGAMTVGGDLNYNCSDGRIAGTVTVGGNLVNSAQAAESKKQSNGLYVPGKLTVGGDVHMGDLLLNYDNYNENIDVTGNIQAYRVADIIVDSDGTYVVEGVEQDPADYITVNDERRVSYTVPFNQRIIPVEIDGELYAVDITDLGAKKFDPIEGAYNLTFDTNGGAFVDGFVPDAAYLSENGADLPTKSEIKRTGYMLEGWYNEDISTTTPVTSIPAGTTGDITLTAHWTECDHKDSETQPTCTESAICTICEAELPALGHTWKDPEWNWDDVEHPTYSTTCSVCEDGEASGEAYSVEPDAHEATVDADGYTDYTASVTLDNQEFSDTHKVIDEGSMLEKRKEAFAAYKDELIADIEDMAQEGDSEECAALIEDAKTAVNNLTYDESKSLDDNKAAADSEADLDKLAADLAEHREIHYATFVAEGKEVEKVPYTIDTDEITPPAVPDKPYYEGEWEPYTLAVGGITVNAKYTYVGTPAVKAINRDSEETVAYKQTEVYKFETAELPDGATTRVFVNGEDKGEGTSVTVEEPTEDYTVECKVFDADGNEIASSGEIKVKVKNSFFDRLKWFFNNFWANILKTFIDAIIKAC